MHLRLQRISVAPTLDLLRCRASVLHARRRNASCLSERKLATLKLPLDLRTARSASQRLCACSHLFNATKAAEQRPKKSRANKGADLFQLKWLFKKRLSKRAEKPLNRTASGKLKPNKQSTLRASPRQKQISAQFPLSLISLAYILRAAVVVVLLALSVAVAVAILHCLLQSDSKSNSKSNHCNYDCAFGSRARLDACSPTQLQTPKTNSDARQRQLSAVLRKLCLRTKHQQNSNGQDTSQFVFAHTISSASIQLLPQTAISELRNQNNKSQTNDEQQSAQVCNRSSQSLAQVAPFASLSSLFASMPRQSNSQLDADDDDECDRRSQLLDAPQQSLDANSHSADFGLFVCGSANGACSASLVLPKGEFLHA